MSKARRAVWSPAAWESPYRRARRSGCEPRHAGFRPSRASGVVPPLRSHATHLEPAGLVFAQLLVDDVGQPPLERAHGLARGLAFAAPSGQVGAGPLVAA